MKAVTCEQYGPPEVLKITTALKPVPKAHEVLIKIKASTANAADCNVRGLTYVPPGLGWLARVMLGFSKPKINIPGSVLAGEVEAVGEAVNTFKPGDQVFWIGPEMGAYAAYACRPEKGALTLKPDNTTFEEAAAVPYGALTALYFLREKAAIQSGQKVLIHGASGGVGVYAVQLAKYFGAEVTGVCSTANVEFVQSLGADRVIDYTKEDFTRRNEKGDIIMDIVVGKTSFTRCKHALTPKGYYLAVAGGLKDMLQMIRTSMGSGKKVVFGGGSESEKKEYLDFLRTLIEAEKLKPIVDKSFPLENIVEAHRYVESGQKRGNITISIGHP
ncbi:MAG: NAD(P)-dependent alcohol dehydrogenase [Bacteroidetes bacterium]|nr:NAD(P)-dependent alcohol dehydrogenase [Bacteroidota bacterium]